MTPTLVASAWISGSEDALVGYMLTGGFGSQVLMGRFDFLNDAEMAAVLSYIRQEYGGGASPITAERVSHSISSNGSTPARVNTRGNSSPGPVEPTGSLAADVISTADS